MKAAAPAIAIARLRHITQITTLCLNPAFLAFSDSPLFSCPETNPQQPYAASPAQSSAHLYELTALSRPAGRLPSRRFSATHSSLTHFLSA